MTVLLKQFRDNPAVAISVLVALLSALIAGGSVLVVGGPAALPLAVLAALSSLLTALTGGQAIRNQSVPLEKHEEIVDTALHLDPRASASEAFDALAEERKVG